jgi:hypothetical protein
MDKLYIRRLPLKYDIQSEDYGIPGIKKEIFFLKRL